MYKFYGQNLQDKFIFERYFKDKKYGVSIECGSFDGVIESSTLFFEETLEWTTINIEASPPIFKMLKENRKGSININKGLSSRDSFLTFQHVIHPVHGVKFGNGSFNHVNSHKMDLISENCEFIEYEVEVTTYNKLIDNIMDENPKLRKIDLFVLDVEGHEIEVINGMVGSRYLPEVICVEYPHVGLDNLKHHLYQLNLNYEFDIIKDNNAFFINKN